MLLLDQLIFSVFFTVCSSENTDRVCDKCNIDIPVMIITQDNANDQMSEKLFCTGADSCLTNVEFMEVYNEALFLSFEKKPEIFIKQLSPGSNKKFILKQLEIPVNDKIDPKKIIGILKQLSLRSNSTFNKVLVALKLAEQKNQ